MYSHYFIPDCISKLIKLSRAHQICFINNCQISEGCLPEKKRERGEKHSNRSFAVFRSLVWVCVRKRENSKRCTKDQSHRIAFHTLYYCLQIPHSLINAKDCVCACVCLSRSINTHSLCCFVSTPSLCCLTACGWYTQKAPPFCVVGKHKQRTEAETMASDTCEHSSVLKSSPVGLTDNSWAGRETASDCETSLLLPLSAPSHMVD